MMKAESLTEKFKNGTLKQDWYYCKFEDGGVDLVFITNDENNLCYNRRVYRRITKVLEKAPSYRQYKKMKEMKKLY